MFLMYWVDTKGHKRYTLSKMDPQGNPCHPAHPARFSPDDKHSEHRIRIKKRFGVLPTQRDPPKL